VTGDAPFAFVDGWPLAEVLPPPPTAAGAARTELNVAAPAGVAAGFAVPELAVPELAGIGRAGSAIIEIRAVAEPGAAGGQDLVIDVTAASWPPCALARVVPGCVPQAIANTTASASSTAPGRVRRRIRTLRRRLAGYPNRASGVAGRAWPPGVNAAPASRAAR
jgi:hypothetical protein